MTQRNATITTRLCDERKESLANWCTRNDVSLSEASRAGLELFYLLDTLQPDEIITVLEDGAIEDPSGNMHSPATNGDAIESETDELDYNNLSDDAVINPDEADFGDTDIVKQNNRIDVFGGVLRWYDQYKKDQYWRYELREELTSLYSVTTETADQYIARAVDADLLHRNITLDPRLTSPGAVQELKHDVVEYYYDLGTDDAVMTGYGHAYDEVKSINDLSGTYHTGREKIGQNWFDKQFVYFRECSDAEQFNAEFVESSLEREFSDEIYNYSSKRILSRMLAIAVEDGIWSAREARRLMAERTPFDGVVPTGSVESRVWGSEE